MGRKFWISLLSFEQKSCPNKSCKLQTPYTRKPQIRLSKWYNSDLKSIPGIEKTTSYHDKAPCSAWIIISCEQTTRLRFEAIIYKRRAKCFLFLLDGIFCSSSRELQNCSNASFHLSQANCFLIRIWKTGQRYLFIAKLLIINGREVLKFILKRLGISSIFWLIGCIQLHFWT